MDRSTVISNDEIELLTRSFHQSPLIQMIRQMLINQLLNNGIKFCQGDCKNTTLKMDIEEEDLVEDKWVPFCSALIDSVISIGIAVVHIGKCFPTVLPVDIYTLKRTLDVKTMEYEYTVFDRNAVEETIPNAVVYDHFGFSPLYNGDINSPLQKILPRLQYLKHLRKTCIHMEMQRSLPQYFSEHKDTGRNTTNTEGVQYDYYAEANMADTSENMKFQRNKAAMDLFNKQKDLYESYLRPEHASKSVAILENVTQMPMGSTIKNAAQNSGRNDIVHIHRIVQEEVCATFGVPRSMIFADGSNRTMDVVGTHQTFMHTLMFWKKKMSVVLSDVYNLINLDKITEKINFTGDTCVEELKRKHRIHVYFPVTPFVQNDELRKLYEQGVINFKAYGEYSLRNISLPISDLQPKAPPIDDLLFEKPPKEVPTGGSSSAAARPKPAPKAAPKAAAKDKTKDKKDNQTRSLRQKKDENPEKGKKETTGKTGPPKTKKRKL